MSHGTLKCVLTCGVNGGLLRMGGVSRLFGNPPNCRFPWHLKPPLVGPRFWALFDAYEHETVVRRSVLLPAPWIG